MVWDITIAVYKMHTHNTGFCELTHIHKPEVG